MNDWKKEINKVKEFFSTNIPIQKIVLLVSLSFVITYLVYPSKEFSHLSLKEGDIAPETIKTSRNYIIVDKKTTELKKREAADNTPFLFHYDHALKEDIVKNIEKAFRTLRDSTEKKNDENLRTFNDILGIEVSDKHFAELSKRAFNRAIERIITNIVRKIQTLYIINDKEIVETSVLPTILVSSEDQPLSELPEVVQIKAIHDLQSAREKINFLIGDNTISRSFDRATKDMMSTIAQKLIRTNLKFDDEGTDTAKDAAATNIKEATINIQKGEVVVRLGDRINTDDVVILEGLREATHSRTRGILFFGIFLFHLVFIFIAYLFAIMYFKDFKPTFGDLLFLSITLIATIVIVDIFQFISNLVHEGDSQIPLDAFNFVIPVFASCMLIALVLNFEIAFVFAIILSIILGLASEYSTILSGRGIYYSFYCFCGSLVAIKGTYKSNQRISIFKAGLILGLFNTTIVIILTFLESKLFLIGTATDYLYPMAMACTSGILSAMIVLGITPFVELFGYTTDIKLLELANTDNPLLSKLAIEAPGTYHHSFVVSRLAEGAAEAIGVNSLLVKVACLYHDIGKVLKPSYFIENQDPKHNKHDTLAPHMSSMIIQSHVKEGIELAKKSKLPKAIIDLIPQHHGTSLISYFYKKAVSLENKDVDTVDEQDYRYQGPRPKGKEGAIIMLADSIEATARSIEDPTPGKLKDVVDSTITKRFTDGQLDDCDLTFNDLNIIAESFTNTLIKSIYHPRISYIIEEKTHEDKPHQSSEKV